MDSFSVLLTSCIVIVLLALTTFKYAYIKLKKPKSEDEDDVVPVVPENEKLFRDSSIKANGKVPVSRKSSRLSNSFADSFPLREEDDEQLLKELEEEKETSSNQKLLVRNGSCKQVKYTTDNNANGIEGYCDQVDFGRSTSSSPISSSKGSEETEVLSDCSEKESLDVIEKTTQNGNVKTTRIVYTRPTAADNLAENFIKEIEKNVVANADKSTLIIHAVQKAPISAIQEEGQQCKLDDCEFDEFPLPNPTLPEQIEQNADEALVNNKPSRKSRRGSLFSSLRHRLSKKHSYSVKNPRIWETEREQENDMIMEKDDIILRCSITPSEEDILNGNTKHNNVLLNSSRSSTSELSTFSRQSTVTYTHEKSTLVIEVMENQVRKFYLVPPHMIQNGSWRKKGKKLHIFNDHSFVAKHVMGGKNCEICSMRIPFSLGKQGYQCRDCKILCHKECHVRTPTPCPKTTVYQYEL